MGRKLCHECTNVFTVCTSCTSKWRNMPSPHNTVEHLAWHQNTDNSGFWDPVFPVPRNKCLNQYSSTRVPQNPGVSPAQLGFHEKQQKCYLGLLSTDPLFKNSESTNAWNKLPGYIYSWGHFIVFWNNWIRTWVISSYLKCCFGTRRLNWRTGSSTTVKTLKFTCLVSFILFKDS